MKGIKGIGRLVSAALVLAALSGFPALTGCDSSSDGAAPELLAVWQLRAFLADGEVTTQVDDPSKYTIEFRPDKTAHIVSDCNRCSGRYVVEGSGLRFGNLACTVAACGPDSLDTQFQGAIAAVESYEIEGGSLFLDYGEGELRLTPAPALY